MMISMQQVLNLPLTARYDSIVRLVNDCTNKELENLLPVLVEDIFGVNNQVGWGLRNVKYNTHVYEFELLFKFLHPSGPIFKLCYKLLSDCHLKYDFPIAYLPAKVQQMISDGMVLPFYTDKLQVEHKTRTPVGLNLNPFELYMFHFVYHMINNNIQVPADPSQYWQWDTLYLRLAEEYLNTFLPCNGSTVYPVTNLHAGQTNPRTHSMPFPVRPARSPTLLRQSVLLKHSATSQCHSSLPNCVQASPMMEIWRSELVARLCVDYWLGTSNWDSQSYFTSRHYRNWLMHPQTNMYQSCTSPIWSQQVLPSGEHLWVVRYMVKHLHYFSNSLIEDSSAMDELKRVIIPSSQGKLYKFLRYTMQHWPLDSSFRLILETWLSYIQPWRYKDYNRKVSKDSDEKASPVEARWLPFIAENLLAYSLVFQLLIMRFSRIDLATPKNALMLFRLTKVFSQVNLKEFLREVEEGLEEGRRWAGVVRQHIVDLEGPGFQYKLLFGPETRAEVIRFQGQLQQALITAQRRVEAEAENQRGGFLCWFMMPSFSFEYSLDERKKVGTYLKSSFNSLNAIFGLDMDETPQPIVADLNLNTTPANISRQDQSVLFWKRNQKTMKYEGDPDLQPIRSFENSFLVRLLYHLSSWLNCMYHNEMNHLYQRENCWGGVARQVLCGPLTIKTYDKSGPGGFSPRITSTLPPRLSLRIWAQHRTLFFLLIAYLIIRFLGYTTSVVVIISLFLWFLLLLVNYAVGWAPKPPYRSDVSFDASY